MGKILQRQIIKGESLKFQNTNTVLYLQIHFIIKENQHGTQDGTRTVKFDSLCSESVCGLFLPLNQLEMEQTKIEKQ